MNKLDNREIELILELHKQDKTNRQIAKVVGKHHNTIGYHLKRHGLVSNHMKPLNIISDTEAKCSKCLKVYLIEEFQFGRKGTPREYKFSYCNRCRKTQSYDALNKNVDAFLKDRENRLRLRAKKGKITIDIPTGYISQLWHIQNGKCFYTDKDMAWGTGNGITPLSVSIDKIIPEEGYTVKNTVLCCNRINTIKSNVSIDELAEWMPGWYNRVMTYWQVNEGNF